MLRWPFKKRALESGVQSDSGPIAEPDEWEYLRGRPDHDEEEMAGVRRRAEPDAAAAFPAAAELLGEDPPLIFSGEELTALSTLVPPGMEELDLTDEDRLLAEMAWEALGLEPGAEPERSADPQRDVDLLDLALTSLERDRIPQSGRMNL